MEIEKKRYANGGSEAWVCSDLDDWRVHLICDGSTEWCWLDIYDWNAQDGSNDCYFRCRIHAPSGAMRFDWNEASEIARFGMQVAVAMTSVVPRVARELWEGR